MKESLCKYILIIYYIKKRQARTQTYKIFETRIGIVHKLEPKSIPPCIFARQRGYRASESSCGGHKGRISWCVSGVAPRRAVGALAGSRSLVLGEVRVRGAVAQLAVTGAAWNNTKGGLVLN